MTEEQIAREKSVAQKIRLFVRNLLEPCHTSAYGTGHELDEMLRKHLATPSGSDYGHSGGLIYAIADALEEVKWNGETFLERRRRMRETDAPR